MNGKRRRRPKKKMGTKKEDKRESMGQRTLASGREKDYDKQKERTCPAGQKKEGERMEQEKARSYYVYMLRCADDTLYTGSTTDLARREQAHNSGKGAKYTRARRPVKMVYHEQLPSWPDALRREAAIKKLKRAEKEKLIEGGTAAEKQNNSELCT